MNKAAFVAAGILLSRLAGLVRLRVFAYYFGLQSNAADAFNAAFRIPNLIQNLFGEGALSASFIPVYAGLVAGGRRREADRVAAAVGALLAAIVAALVLAGILAAPLLTAAIAPGFSGEQRALTVRLVRILFPGAGLLVVSAWCLGVLNSHGRFLLAYAAPVVWNVAMVVTLVAVGGEDLPRLAVWLAWGSVVGSVLQFVVQVPVVLRVAPELFLALKAGGGLGTAGGQVRTVARNFVPASMSRGVVQISAFVDTVLASLLPTGAMTGLANAQLIYTLPVSLFGMSVAAAELPAMAREAAPGPGTQATLGGRLNAGLGRIAFFVVPSALAFLALGDVVAGAILQTGRFTSSDARLVWAILAGAAVGLPASTLGRLYASTFYALGDTRTPLGYAAMRVGVAALLAVTLCLAVPRAFGVPLLWGAAGITTASGVGAWVELSLLRAALNRRIGPTGIAWPHVARLVVAAVAGAVVGWAAKIASSGWHPLATAVVAIGPFGCVYLGVAALLGVRIPAIRFRSGA